jgi:hypothetical protein
MEMSSYVQNRIFKFLIMKKILFLWVISFAQFTFSQEGFIIETPEMLVFYEGIPIELKAWATGDYKDVRMSVPSPYTAAKGSAGSVVTVTLVGTDSEGDAVALGSKKFVVKKAPKPSLFWAGVEEGGRANKSAGVLTCRYGDNVPFLPSKGYFSILNYSITVEGVQGSLEGMGSSISSTHLEILKGMPEVKVTISVRVTGAYEGIISAGFMLSN